MYPYGYDLFMDFCPVDDKFKKADISKLIEILDEALKEEMNTFEKFDNPYEDTDEDEYNALMEQGGDWEG